MHEETSVCQALSVGGLINETDHSVSVCLESVYSEAGQLDFNSNSADFHHFPRVPPYCVLQTKSPTKQDYSNIFSFCFFFLLQKSIIKFSLNTKYSVWTTFSLHLRLIYSFPRLCEIILPEVDWLVIFPARPLLPLSSLSFPLLYFLSLSDWYDCRCPSERAHSNHAGHLHQGCSSGQTGKQERLPVSSIQDLPEGPHIRVDL